MTTPLISSLGLNVSDPKVRTYVEAVMSHLQDYADAKLRIAEDRNTELSKRVKALETELETARTSLASLKGRIEVFEGYGEDDRYLLTKAKVIQLMKAMGWYE